MHNDRREEILNIIVGYMLKHGYPPSIREIADMAGFKSTSSSHKLLKELEADGLIGLGAFSQSRAIRVHGVRYIDERGKDVIVVRDSGGDPV